MKTFTLFTIIVILLLPIQMFSQQNDKSELRPDNLLQERIIPHSIQDDKAGHPFKSDVFQDNNSRTIINKTILDDGFLLIEELQQNWDESNWVNTWMYTYTYDVNNNLIEVLWQEWGFYEDSFYKFTYTYDVNNNRIESL